MGLTLIERLAMLLAFHFIESLQLDFITLPTDPPPIRAH
jgi:hypothetical protein